ncbi:50S ribosomal protein L11 methyltransferase [Sphingobacterium sp. UT-1RO-CII-1]|uniref:50S ribosomal protein L11 methyltransferase n=1 Tax=Sphingobacterium sp. UT-1RO-CII-1 TaxID=2995225 RepID=UPI00227A8A85|nr:50S ribosomal protein L11 methyltransferase [Sphingobacterium sp. UT-1RO-CII-1]MCY4779439.1 50S ribosomal protein L11 methyltransferase [Sphingobacterium sp. UT-1RO-CII-1]
MKYSSVIFTSTNMEDWQKDLLIDSLGDVGYDTFEDIVKGFVAYIPTANLDVQVLETVLLSNTNGFDVFYEIEDIEEQNWNSLWESNFQPITVDGLCYVRATFHEPQIDLPYEIVIDPKMSFGTGHHQTTSMMLSYILENDFKGKDVLDMGCGTGILAILAAKRDARTVLAVDYDEICVASVEENKVLNNVMMIESKLGSKEVIHGKAVDVILANINRNILIDQLDEYAIVLRENGELYMSGFYESPDLEILRGKADSLGLLYQNHKVLDKWCSAKFIKKY